MPSADVKCRVFAVKDKRSIERDDLEEEYQNLVERLSDSLNEELEPEKYKGKLLRETEEEKGFFGEWPYDAEGTFKGKNIFGAVQHSYKGKTRFDIVVTQEDEDCRDTIQDMAEFFNEEGYFAGFA